MVDHEPPTLIRSGCIRDARGQRVSQVDPVALHLLGRHDVIVGDALGRIVEEPGVRISRGERAALIGGFGAMLLVIGLFTHALITRDIRDAPLAKSASLLYFCMIPWIIWCVLKYRRFGHVAAAMLKHGHCPHCGYDLRMLPAEADDGITVCPECGCGWRLGVQ